ncbi:hypothetical protein Tsubulata_019235 [Turnera subulata]|uniref:Uncharacterized protein n=1 Tax=Turnera subulata TaxID=218843 RepID=A0A9Q0GL27_9ROSI|nr:hypothetical protein Tsubulata_019235 [Turnera subulata]
MVRVVVVDGDAAGDDGGDDDDGDDDEDEDGTYGGWCFGQQKRVVEAKFVLDSWRIDFVLELNLIVWISISSYGGDFLEHIVFRIETCIIRFKHPFSSVISPKFEVPWCSISVPQQCLSKSYLYPI